MSERIRNINTAEVSAMPDWIGKNSRPFLNRIKPNIRVFLAGSLLLLSACGPTPGENNNAKGSIAPLPTVAARQLQPNEYQVTATPTLDRDTTAIVQLAQSVNSEATSVASLNQRVSEMSAQRKNPSVIPTSSSSRVAVNSTLNDGALPTPQETVTTVVDHLLHQDECFTVPQNSVVSGDVTADGTRLFDDDPNTGLVVEAKAGTTICAPFGADIHIVGNNPQVQAQIVGTVTNQMKASGCENGCGWVYDVRWPKEVPQSQVAPGK